MAIRQKQIVESRKRQWEQIERRVRQQQQQQPHQQPHRGARRHRR